jgi:hypothetical protein
MQAARIAALIHVNRGEGFVATTGRSRMRKTDGDPAAESRPAPGVKPVVAHLLAGGGDDR